MTDSSFNVDDERCLNLKIQNICSIMQQRKYKLDSNSYDPSEYADIEDEGMVPINSIADL